MDADRLLIDVDAPQSLEIHALQFQSLFDDSKFSPAEKVSTLLSAEAVDSHTGRSQRFSLGDDYDDVYCITSKLGSRFCVKMEEESVEAVLSFQDTMLEEEKATHEEDDDDPCWQVPACIFCAANHAVLNSRTRWFKCSCCEAVACEHCTRRPFFKSTADGAARLDVLCPSCSTATALIDTAVHFVNKPGFAPVVLKVMPFVSLVSDGPPTLISASAYILVKLRLEEIGTGTVSPVYGPLAAAVESMVRMLDTQQAFLERHGRWVVDLKLGNLVMHPTSRNLATGEWKPVRFEGIDFPSLIRIDDCRSICACHCVLGPVTVLEAIGVSIGEDGILHLPKDLDRARRVLLLQMLTCSGLLGMFANILFPTVSRRCRQLLL